LGQVALPRNVKTDSVHQLQPKGSDTPRVSLSLDETTGYVGSVYDSPFLTIQKDTSARCRATAPTAFCWPFRAWTLRCWLPRRTPTSGTDSHRTATCLLCPTQTLIILIPSHVFISSRNSDGVSPLVTSR
jgi:hypothetical protein